MAVAEIHRFAIDAGSTVWVGQCAGCGTWFLIEAGGTDATMRFMVDGPTCRECDPRGNDPGPGGLATAQMPDVRAALDQAGPVSGRPPRAPSTKDRTAFDDRKPRPPSQPHHPRQMNPTGTHPAAYVGHDGRRPGLRRRHQPGDFSVEHSAEPQDHRPPCGKRNNRWRRQNDPRRPGRARQTYHPPEHLDHRQAQHPHHHGQVMAVSTKQSGCIRGTRAVRVKPSRRTARLAVSWSALGVSKGRSARWRVLARSVGWRGFGPWPG
jgi:hypothetical protein